MRQILRGFLLLAGIMSASVVWARDFYIAPEGYPAAAKADGSRDAPFPNAWIAFTKGNIKPGDRVLLMDGEYGNLKLLRADFDAAVTVMPENPGRAHLDSLSIDQSRNLHVVGLSVWPRQAQPKIRNLVTVGNKTRDIKLQDFDIRSREDAPDTYMNWTADDWKSEWRVGGVLMHGTNNALLNSKITATGFAITAMGDRAEVRGNHVMGFSGDAMRGLGDGGVFAENRIENCARVDGNHMDAFQSWSSRKEKGRPLRDLVLDANTIIEWTGPTDRPVGCRLQGLALFDGPFENVTITNNLIAITAYHGIALFGADNSVVLNNTVVQPGGKPGGLPWIMITGRKNQKTNVVVANNIANAYKSVPNPLRLNATVRFPGQFFMAPDKNDFRPKPGGPLIGRSDPRFTPEHDIAGNRRPAGTGDLGAYQSQ